MTFLVCFSDDTRCDAASDVASILQIDGDDNRPHDGAERRSVPRDALKDGRWAKKRFVQLPVASLKSFRIDHSRPKNDSTSTESAKVAGNDPPLLFESIKEWRARNRRHDVNPRHRYGIAHDEVVGPFEDRLVVAVEPDHHLRRNVDPG